MMKHLNRNELLVYALIWGVIFATDIIGLYTRSLVSPMTIFDWRTVAIETISIGMTLVFFLIHNFFIAPLLVYRNKYVAYAVSIVALSVLFVLWQVNSSPVPPDLPVEHTADGRAIPPEPSPERQRLFRPGPPPGIGEPDFFTEKIDIVAASMFIVMLGLNVSVKYYFRLSSERKRFKDIEKRSLELQLEYLKYQINPHFYMNTLNNIHALVEIDPQAAQRSIVELSKMMRYVLYECSKPLVPLQKEIDFVRDYIRLMRIRFSDSVKIGIEVAEPLPDMTVPPLITIPFVENAFKHGISYIRDSFVRVSYDVESSMLVFRCSNSKIESQHDVHGGVGLDNVRHRLQLIYGSTYKLIIDDRDNVYSVELRLPQKKDIEIKRITEEYIQSTLNNA